MDTFSGAGVHDVSTAIVLPSLRFSRVPRISRRHEDMSTTSDPRNSTAYGAGDQESRHNADCADLVIVPTCGLTRLRGRGSAAGGSAQSRCSG
jgi:hypothetical protein